MRLLPLVRTGPDLIVASTCYSIKDLHTALTSNPAELTLPDEGDEGVVGMSAAEGGDVIDDVITTR